MNTPKIPEDLILAMMQLSGKNRSEVKAILNKAVAEMNMMGKHSNATKTRKRLSAEDRRRLEWVGWDADYDPGELDLEECRRIVEEYNT